MFEVKDPPLVEQREDRIVIMRMNVWSVGAKNWFVIEDEKSNRFQRWSNAMDSTDEILMVAQKGDSVLVKYDKTIREDGTVQRVITYLERLNSDSVIV